MAEFRTIRSAAFWESPFVYDMSAYGKLLYLYLFTNPHLSNLGVMRISNKAIANETGIPADDVETCLGSLERAGKIFRDTETGAILVKNFIKHQTNTSPKMRLSLKALMPEVKYGSIAAELVADYPFLGEDAVKAPVAEEADRVSIPYPYPTDTVSIPYRYPIGGSREVRNEGSLEVREEISSSSLHGIMTKREDSTVLPLAVRDGSRPAGGGANVTPTATTFKYPDPGNSPRVKAKETPEAYQARYMAWAKAKGRHLIEVYEQDWQVAYPALNIRRECAAAFAWLSANPTQRKTNIARFLTNWLSRNQERSGRGLNPANGATGAQPKTFAQMKQDNTINAANELLAELEAKEAQDD